MTTAGSQVTLPSVRIIRSGGRAGCDLILARVRSEAPSGGPGGASPLSVEQSG